jgi:hypothetical protein
MLNFSAVETFYRYAALNGESGKMLTKDPHFRLTGMEFVLCVALCLL